MSRGRFAVVLFDLDGTLAESLPQLFDVYSGFLAAFGKAATRSEFEHLSGKTLAEIVDSLAARHQLPVPAGELLDRYRSLIEDCYAKTIRPDPEALGLLRGLREQGVRLGIVTSGASGPAKAFLQSHGLLTYFEHVTTSDDFVRGKPDPEPYLRALTAFGVTAGDALAVEDSTNGVCSARAAGIRTLRVKGGPDAPDSISTLSEVSNFLEAEPDGCRIFSLASPLQVFARQDPPDSSRLAPAVLESVERAWAQANAKRERPLTNGSMFVYIDRVDEHTVLGRFTEYKFYVAQKTFPDLVEKLRIAPLAVSGMTVVEDAVVFGRRSDQVTGYPGFWELVPAGGITVGCLTESGNVDYQRQILSELEEEMGIHRGGIRSVEPFALILDPRDNVYDICVEIRAEGGKADVSHWSFNRGEHSSLRAVEFAELDAFVDENQPQILPTSLGILRAAKCGRLTRKS